MKSNLWVAIILLPLFLSAQKEDYIWYFGRTGAGLDFNPMAGSTDCEPRLITDTNTMSWEGAVSMCDKNTGRLLFYSDGIFLYNTEGNWMAGNSPAGLWNSNTQNVIIQQPGSDSIYYFISPEPQAFCTIGNLLHHGLMYAIIDMSLDSGRGEIISRFNPLLDSGSCEKLTTVRNANGQDIWIVGHRYHNNSFFVFNVTGAGIDTIPAYYNVGPVIYTPQGGIAGINCFDAIGELKASTDGQKLAFTTFYNGISALFDFDNSTGVISNPIQLDLGWGGYGVSFSPDNSKLYIAGGDSSLITTTGGGGRLYQFDISSGDSAIINNSKTLIYQSAAYSYGSLKLAPNGKIYGTLHSGNSAFGAPYLEVINYPDMAGLACGYLNNGFSLNGLWSSWGLNNSMEHYNHCMTDGILQFSENNFELSITPNPTTGPFEVSSNKKITGGLIFIYNLLGEQVYTTSLNNNRQIINCRLSAGIYFVRLISENGSAVQKLIVEEN